MCRARLRLFAADHFLALLALIALSWRRLRQLPRALLRMPYVTFAATYVVVFVYAFSVIGNFGILARQRTQMLPFLFVLLALPAALPRRGQPRSVEPRTSEPEAPRRFDRWAWVRTARMT